MYFTFLDFDSLNREKNKTKNSSHTIYKIQSNKN